MDPRARDLSRGGGADHPRGARPPSDVQSSGGRLGEIRQQLGNITALALYDFATRAFDAWDQRPTLKGYIETASAIRCVEPALDADILRRLPERFDSADEVLRLTPEHEGERIEGHPLTPEQQEFEELKRLRNAGLLEGAEGQDLYWAAVEGGSVRLTPLGKYFWTLASSGRL